jgi:hypothetical protein
MGFFVRQHFTNQIDGMWEDFVKPKRDRFSEYALPIGSCIVLVASLGGLLLDDQFEVLRPQWFGKVVSVWFAVSLILIWAVHFLSAWRLRTLDDEKPKTNSTSNRATATLSAPSSRE